MMNYFELMNLPEQFDIDMAQLQQTMRQLQSKFHPDNNLDSSISPQSNDFIENSMTTQLATLKSEQASAIINEAYNALKNPDTRASHLLSLKGISQSINQPIRDLDFLDDAMTFRIDLEDSNNQTISSLQQKLTTWLNSYEKEFSEIYQKLSGLDAKLSEDNQMVSKALSLIQKLQFLVKLQADVEKKTDELANQSFGNDEDLYV